MSTKSNWENQAERNRKNMEQAIAEFSQSFDKHPERIPDFLAFGSRFYRHSLKNNMLIYGSNPKAIYCQSYEAWNKNVHKIKKNEKGIKVYVPVETTILKIERNLVPLEQATKEEQLQYQAGELESITKTRYGIKVIFDIAQTTCPVTEYKQYFQLEYSEQQMEEIVKGLQDYAKDLGCSLRISGKKTSAQKLSEYMYQVGQGILSQQLEKKEPERNFEALALGIIMENYYGLQTAETVKNKCLEYYNDLKESMPETSLFENLNRTYKVARQYMPEVHNHIQKNLMLLQAQAEQKSSIRPEKKQEQKSEPRMQNEEIFEQIKQQVSIVDYAAVNGISLKKIGRYYTMEGHDSVRIDTEKNCYWQNSIPGQGGRTIGKGDSVIGFAAEFVHNGNMHEALKDLSQRIYLPEHEIPVRKKENVKEQAPRILKLPKRGENLKRVYAYLIKNRYIDQDVVQNFVDRKMLYQDIKGNCVFVAYDNENHPNFACFRGTLSDVRFLGDVPGCDYEKGFYINNHADKLIVAESAIDAASIMSIIKGQGMDYKEYDYQLLGGTGKYGAILERMKEDPKKEVLLALDHDLSGVETMKQIKDLLVSEIKMEPEQVTYHVPPKKDWNQALSETSRQLKPLDQLTFLEKSELPKIHFCSIQSTEQIEERGFRIRDGKHQYRLVEMNSEGNLEPVKISERNTMFFNPGEVEERIPNMYKKIPYKELLEMIKTPLIKEEPQKEKAQRQVQETNAPENYLKPILKGFLEKEGVCMVSLEIEGKDRQEAVWKNEEELYYATGMMCDGTFRKHYFTKEQEEELEKFIKANHYQVDETFPLLQINPADQTPDKTANYLNQLQQQESKNQNVITRPGIEMEMEI